MPNDFLDSHEKELHERFVRHRSGAGPDEKDMAELKDLLLLFRDLSKSGAVKLLKYINSLSRTRKCYDRAGSADGGDSDLKFGLYVSPYEIRRFLEKPGPDISSVHTSSPDECEVTLLESYTQFNSYGRERVLKYINALRCSPELLRPGCTALSGMLYNNPPITISASDLNYIITDFYNRMMKEGKPFIPNMTTIFEIIETETDAPVIVYEELCSKMDSVSE